MRKHNSSAVLLLPANTPRGANLESRLNSRVLQVIRDRSQYLEKDPGVEDEYEFEIFGNVGQTPIKKK